MYQPKLSYEHISLCELPELFMVGRGDQVIRHSVHLQKPWHLNKYLALIFSYLLNYCIWIWLWNRVMLQLAHHWSQHCLNEVVEGGQMSQKFWLDILNIFKVATKVGHFSWYILYQFLSLSPLYIFFIYFEILCFTYFKIHLRANCHYTPTL